LFVITSFLVTILVGTATAWTLKSTVADRETVKNWLLVSGVYDNFVDEIVAVSAGAAADDPDVATIDQATLTNAARAAFPPALLQDSLETVLDGSYNWLEGTTDSLDFTVDFTEAKSMFASELALAVKIKADELPACTPTEVPESLDIFAATCLPVATSSSDISSEFENSILNSEELLKDPIITGDSILVNKGDQQIPIAEAYPEIATWYQRALWLPAALTVVSLLAAVSVVLLSDTRRRGILHLVKAFTFASFSIGLTAFIASIAPLSTGGIGGGDDAAEGFSERILTPFLQEAIDSYIFWSIQFVVLYGALMLSCAVYLLLTYHKQQKGPAARPVPDTEHQVNLPIKKR